MDKKSQLKIFFIFLIVLTLLSTLIFAFTLTTDKNNYSLGEKVLIDVTPIDANKTFLITTPNGEVNTDVSEYTPSSIGRYSILATLVYENESAELSTNFDVYSAEVLEKKKDETEIFDSDKESKKIEAKLNKVKVKRINKNNDELELDVETADRKSSIKFKGMKDASDLKEVKKVKLNNKKIKIEDKDVELGTDALFVNANNFTEANVTLTKLSDVNTILYCSDSDFVNDCLSGWIDSGLPFIDNGDGTISFTVNHFTTYAGGWMNQSISFSSTSVDYDQTMNNSVNITLAYNMWVTKNPSSLPARRRYSAIAYDSDNKIIVMYGGLNGTIYHNDTWTYNLSSNIWINKTNYSNLPPGRYAHAMAYDSDNKLIVIYGGNNGVVNLADTWVYNVSSNIWINKTNTSNSPSARQGQVMAYDSTNKLVVMYGGNTGSYNSETWTYNASSNIWNNTNPSSPPTARWLHAMAYDSDNKLMIMYGGHTGIYNSETWAYNLSNNSWSQKATGPSARYGHTMAYDSINKLTILYGGYNAGTYYSDTWKYNSSANAWTNTNPSNAPTARASHSMAYDSDNKAIVIYGGENGTSFNTTSVYNLQYFSSGTYTQTIDANQTVILESINYISNKPDGTNITYQVATSADNITWTAFTGYDGTIATYYNDSNQALNVSNSRYFKYIFYLSTTNISVTPTVSNITVKYNYPTIAYDNTTVTNTSNTTQLKIWDSTDNNQFSNYLTFYANYTNFTTGENLTGADCYFSENSTSVWSTPILMSYLNNLYIYTKEINGPSYFNVVCNITGYDTLNATDEITGIPSIICNLGNYNTECNVTTSKTFTSNNFTLQVNNLILNDSIIINNTNGLIVNFTGNLSILNGSKLNISTILNSQNIQSLIVAGNLTVTRDAVNLSPSIYDINGSIILPQYSMINLSSNLIVKPGQTITATTLNTKNLTANGRILMLGSDINVEGDFTINNTVTSSNVNVTGNLIIQNNGTLNAMNITVGGNVTNNGTISFNANNGKLNGVNLDVYSNGKINASTGTESFTLNLTGNLTVFSGASIETVVGAGQYAGNISINSKDFTNYGLIKNKGGYSGKIIILTNTSFFNINSLINATGTNSNGIINITKDYCSIQNASFNPLPNFTYRIAGCALNISYALSGSRYHFGETVNITNGTAYFNDGYVASGYSANILLNSVLNRTVSTNNTGEFNTNLTVGAWTAGVNTIGVNITVPYVPVSNVTNYNIEYWPYTYITHLTQSQTDDEVDIDDGFVNITAYYYRNDTNASINGLINITLNNGTDNFSKQQNCAANCTMTFTLGVDIPNTLGNYTVTISATNETAYYENASQTFTLRIRQALISINLSNGMHLVNRTYPNITLTVRGHANYDDGTNIGNNLLNVYLDGILQNITTGNGVEITPDSSTVLLMHFNNQSVYGENNTKAYDFSRNGNNGTINGGAIYTSSGKLNGAYQFDGGNQFVNISDSSSLSALNNITLLVWVKFSNINLKDYMGIISKRNVPNYEWVLETSGNKTYFEIDSSNGVAIYRGRSSLKNNTYLVDGNYHFISVTYDGSGNANNIHMYIDGVLDDGAITSVGTWVSISDTAAPVKIGSHYDNTNYNFNGSIDEVAIWNRSLSASEIRQIYLQQVSAYTNSSGDYAFTFTSPNSSSLGVHNLLLNLTTNTSIVGINQTSFEVWAPTIVNYTNQGVNNEVDIDITEFNITAYYYRNDTNNLINGNITITVGPNSTNCIGVNNCTLTINPTQFSLGNYTVNITASNASAYYENAINNFTLKIRQAYITENITSGLHLVNRTYPNTTITVRGHANYDGGSAIINNLLNIYLGEIKINTLNTQGLIGYYYLDNNSNYGENSTKIYDFSGNNNNGSVTNAVWTSVGKINGAYQFDGSGDWINLTSSFNNTNNYSISAWVYTRDSNLNYIYGERQSGLPVKAGVYIQSNIINFGVRDNSGVTATVQSGAITLNNWYHIVAVRTGNNLTLYVNNQVYNASANFGVISNTSIAQIGNDGISSSGVADFNGSIDEVAIYNRSLSQTEITLMYLATNSSGDYIFNFTSPNSSSLGVHNLLLNLTTNTSIVGTNQTSFEVWAQTFTNYTTTDADNIIDIDAGQINITAYYFRNDSIALIPGNISITINGVTKSSIGVNNYTASFNTISELGIGNFTVLITANNDSAYYENASATFRIVIDNITSTIITNATNSIIDIGQTINVSGVASANYSNLSYANLFIGNIFCGNTTLTGKQNIAWSKICLINNSWSGLIGVNTITANIYDLAGNLNGIYQTAITIKAPTLTNYTFNYTGNYVDILQDNITVTAYYFRTDLNQSINGEINITFNNGTANITQSCASANNCTKIFTSPKTLGNYQFTIFSSNDSAYYNNATSTIDFKITTQNIILQTDRTLYNYYDNITLTGAVRLNNGSNLQNTTNTNYSIYYDNVLQTINQTNENGLYSLTIAAPTTAGLHIIKINLTDSNNIYGKANTTITVRIPLTNQSALSTRNNSNYTTYGENTNINVTIPETNIGTDTINRTWIELTKNHSYINITAGKDTYVDQTNPSQSHETNSTIEIKGIDTSELRIYIYFNLSDIPENAIIENATLYLQSTTGSKSMNITIYPLTEGWQENINWTNKPAHTINANNIINYNNQSIGSHVGYDLTNTTIYLHQNGYYGITLIGQNNSNQTHFRTIDHDLNIAPKLSIEYTIPEIINLTGNTNGGMFNTLYSLNNFLGTIRVKFYTILQSGINNILDTNTYYNVQEITLNYTINSTQFTTEKLVIQGNAYKNNGLVNSSEQSLNISIYINGTLINTTLTDSNGLFSYNYTNPSNTLGQHTLTLNATNTNEIFVTKTDSFTTYTKTILNYTYNVTYINGNSTINITANYYRNDTLENILGNYNITINGTTQNCQNQNICNKIFYTPQNITPANQTIYLESEGLSSYYWPQNNSFVYRFETAIGTTSIIADDYLVRNYSYTNGISYLYNVTIINSNDSILSNVNIYTTQSASTHIASINRTYTNCINLTYNAQCYATFNITLNNNLAPPQEPLAYVIQNFEINYTNKDNTVTSLSIIGNHTIEGNPQYDVSPTNTIFNTTLGTQKRAIINITSNGNKDLKNINISNPQSQLFTFSQYTYIFWQYDDTPVWNTDGWNTLAYNRFRSLAINFTLTNYSYADYTYLFNVTLNPDGEQNNKLNKTFNITINVRPNMTTIDQVLFNTNLTSTQTFDTKLNITGNAPITNVTLSIINSTIPAGWINLTSTEQTFQSPSYNRLNESTSNNLRIIVNVRNNSLKDYSGLIKIISNENIERYINLTIYVAPNISVNTTTIAFSQNHNTTSNVSFRINNNGNINITGIRAIFNSTQINTSYVTITPATLSNLTENNNYDFIIRTNIPEYHDAGTYNGTISITSNNTITQIINVSIEVLGTNTWHYNTTYTEPVNFTLSQKGGIANITIFNTGNIPLNFTLYFIDSSGDYKNCSDNSFGVGQSCIDYTTLNSIGITGDETSNPMTALVNIPKNSSKIIILKQDVNFAFSFRNVGIIINMTVAGAPSYNTTYVNFNILDMPPTLFDKTFSPESKIVEINKEINMTSIVTDDIDINYTDFWINITKPDSTLESYNLQNISSGGGYYTYILNYNNTNISGLYNITIIPKDSDAKQAFFYDNFTVIGATTLTLESQNISVYSVTQTDAQTAQIPINITNTGLVNAYNITLTGTFEFSHTQINISQISANETKQEYTLNITIPERTNNGSYYFTPIITWTNPNGTIENITFQDIAIYVNATHRFNISEQNTSLNIAHGLNQTTNFTLNATGNLNETNITIQATNISDGLNITIQPNNLTLLEIGNEQIINLIVNVQKYIAPLTRFFTINIFNNYFNTTYTANVTTDINTDSLSSHANLETINIQGAADSLTYYRRIWIKSDANINMNYTFTLTGNMSSFTNITQPNYTLTPNENHTVEFYFRSPRDNNYYTANLTINNTYTNETIIIPINFYNNYYDLNILNVSKPNQTLYQDNINVTLEIIYGQTYINDNTNYTITINGTECNILNNTNTNNKTYITCQAPNITDGLTHQLNVIALYNDAEITESDNAGLNIARIYYKDLTAPNLTSLSVTNGTLSTPITINANITDNVNTDKVIASIYTDQNAFIGNYTLTNITTTQYQTNASLTIYGYYKIIITANDTTGNTQTYTSQNVTVQITGNITYTGNTMNLVSNKKILATFNFTNDQGNKINFETNQNGEYNTTFSADYYNILITITNPLAFSGATIINRTLTINFTRAGLFNPLNSENNDFIDMYNLPYTYISETSDTERRIFKYPIRGFAIKSNITSRINKIAIPYSSDDIAAIQSPPASLDASLDSLKIYYCPDWNYVSGSTRCANWTMLNTHKEIESNDNFLAIAELSQNINSSAAFILATVNSNTPVISTDKTEYSTRLNHSQSSSQNMVLYSTGSIDATNIIPQCTGQGCNYITFSSNLIPLLIKSDQTNLTLNTTIPKYTQSGNYTSTISLKHDGGETNVTYLLEILPQENCIATIPQNTYQVGGKITSTLTNITINNTGNTICTINLTTNKNNITLQQNTLTTQPNTTSTTQINYEAPHDIGLYNYNITLTNGQTINLTLNVTHQANIIFVRPNQSLDTNDLITINMTANSIAGAEPNANWTVVIGNSTCINTTHTNNLITCKAPQISGTITQQILITGRFNGLNATDSMTVTYLDNLAPQLINITTEINKNQTNPTLNITYYDDTNLYNTTTTISAIKLGENASTQLNYTTNGQSGYNQIIANMTTLEKGDYNTTITLDGYGGTQTYNYIIEIYQPINLTGRVNRSNEITQTNFTFYRPNTTTIIHQINTDNNGIYNENNFHNRTYDLKIETDKFEMNLKNITLNDTNDILDLKKINFTTDGITINNPEGLAYKIIGYAGHAKFESTDGNLTMCYKQSDHPLNRMADRNNVKILKCENFDFQNLTCIGTWETQTILTKEIQQTPDVKHCFTANSNGFSAYVLTEFETQGAIIDSSGLSTTTGGGGGGGGESWKDGINASEFNSTITALKDALAAVEKIGVDVSEINKELFPGEISKGLIKIANDENETTEIIVTLSGSAADLIKLDQKIITLNSKETRNLEFLVTIPTDIRLGTYAGELILTQPKFTKRIPINIRVVEFKEQQLAFSIKPETNIIAPGKNLNIYTNIYNPTGSPINVTLTIELIDPDLDRVITTIKKEMLVDNFITYSAIFKIDDNQKTGNYVIRGKAKYSRQSKDFEIKDFQNIVVARPLLYKKIGPLMAYEWMIALLCTSLIIFAYIGGKKFIESRKRYHVQLELNELPRNPGPRTAFLGNIAETNMRIFYDLDKLTTHTIVAGSTGGGKSISAQVLAEEALMKGISVIVFDPTAQWTGFLRRQEEKNMLNLYAEFGMNKNSAKAFNGNIHTISNARQKIDLKKYMIPGEIHVFTINSLDPKDIDIFVTNTVSEIFHSNFEESPNLKTLIIYDEVHRLLSKFGGSGEGFIQIERACREFRKWGIGVMLVSQVLSDFVGQIKANINTEIQVKTKDEGDLERLRTKYGEELMKEAIKANVGTGMLQNSSYNKGRPFFVSFRPIMHSTKRLSDEELSKYEKFNAIIEDYEYQLDQLKTLNIDIFDVKIELGLAVKKLKSGAFNMVQIYLDGIKQKLDNLWKKLGKTPKKLVIELVKEETIQNEHKKAKLERAKHEALENAKAKGIMPSTENNELKLENKIIIPKKPKYEGKIEHRIELLKNDFENLKNTTDALKRKGNDTNIEDIQIKKCDADITFLEQDLSEKEFDKLETKLDKLRKELINMNTSHKKEAK